MGLLALPLAFGLHALVDYDLDFLAVAAPTALVSAALLGAGRPAVGGAWRDSPPGERRRRRGCGDLGARRARALDPRRRHRDPTERCRQPRRGRASARRAQGLNPLSPEPLFARATVAGLAGDTPAADAFYVKATRLQPENPATWYQLGIFRYIAGDLCGAYFALNAAYTLDPKSSLFYEGSALDRARAAVNDPENPACGR